MVRLPFTEASVVVGVSDTDLRGDLAVPEAPVGLVVFAHGSGSSRRSPRNRLVASVLHEARFATLLLDLLTPEEERERRNVFDIDLLAGRLVDTTRWVGAEPQIAELPLGAFGASTGAGAALAAAAVEPSIRAVVSRGGRPDLAAWALGRVRVPTLLIVGGDDREVLKLNRAAAAQLRGPTELAVVPGATHLFEEPGALERVSELAVGWFERYLPLA